MVWFPCTFCEKITQSFYENVLKTIRVEILIVCATCSKSLVQEMHRAVLSTIGGVSLQLCSWLGFF